MKWPYVMAMTELAFGIWRVKLKRNIKKTNLGGKILIFK
jgi:hypothetical protein